MIFKQLKYILYYINKYIMYYLTLFKFKYYNYSNYLLKKMLHNNTNDLINIRRKLRVLEKNKRNTMKEIIKYL